MSKSIWVARLAAASLLVGAFCVICFSLQRSLRLATVRVIRSDEGRSQALLIGEVHWYRERLKPADRGQWGNGSHDHSRIATGCYHRLAPLGYVLERYNWFPGPRNTYWADVRLPTALVGALAQPAGPMPVEALQQLWTEPPLAAVGVHAAALASYARPYQTIDIFEPHGEIAKLFRPGDQQRKFNMLQDAGARGGNVRVFDGDALTHLKTGPQSFYHLILVELVRPQGHRIHYVRHLALPGAFETFAGALVPDGVICVNMTTGLDEPHYMCRKPPACLVGPPFQPPEPKEPSMRTISGPAVGP